jgi:hypothetical protein
MLDVRCYSEYLRDGSLEAKGLKFEIALLRDSGGFFMLFRSYSKLKFQ